MVTYGISPQADVSARAVELLTDGARCRVVAAGTDLGELHVPCRAATRCRTPWRRWPPAIELDLPFDAVAEAIGTFTGVARRFERKGERKGVTLVDDYAHHPTEVAATLQAARQAHPGARVVVVFQPHLFSRTRQFAREFGEALLGADVVLVLPVYPARERPVPGVTSASWSMRRPRLGPPQRDCLRLVRRGSSSPRPRSSLRETSCSPSAPATSSTSASAGCLEATVSWGPRRRRLLQRWAIRAPVSGRAAGASPPRWRRRSRFARSRWTGTHRFPATDIEAVLRSALGSPTLTVRPDDLREAVRGLPWIADAQVRISLDGVVSCCRSGEGAGRRCHGRQRAGTGRPRRAPARSRFPPHRGCPS